MRRSLPVAIALAALCGCASVQSNQSGRPQQKSYWAMVGEGVVDPRASFGPVSVIWLHPPERAQLAVVDAAVQQAAVPQQ